MAQIKEVILSQSKLPQFHIDQQYADSLLSPIEDSLGELGARVQQYRERLPMSDADREAIAAAEVALRAAAEAVHDLLAKRHGDGAG